MKAHEIRRRFIEYFEREGHEHRPSSPLVPGNDPTLLFTNAGMVQFKEIFLGEEVAPHPRAVTSQKCVRAGGKHNDLEQVGETARHHTFFEMLGNFSFGDYFKRDAIRFAWEFLTGELGLDRERLFVTVHHTDDEAFDLWVEVAGVPRERIYRLGDRDNFWQMADTGPCGPCSELHYDLRPAEERDIPDTERFEALGEEGRLVELWNLVFMQFDRAADGSMTPLPAPSIDTGAGLERLTAVLQGVDSNYHTDLFRPLLDRAAEVLGVPYDPDTPEGVSYRVLADHARAVAFLLADGVFPANEGRGFVLRRILRRGVRHAYLRGRREPTLVAVVEAVIETMSDVYPELTERRESILRVTRSEEERFLATIEGGMTRFDELAPVGGGGGDGIIPGEEAFRLHDTFGFPLDLTQLMARERGFTVDVAGFEAALEEQRARSRADRAASGVGAGGEGVEGWNFLVEAPEQRWTGWERRDEETRVLAVYRDGARGGVLLEANPFYAEAGGQVSDTGFVEGDGWTLEVEEVRRRGGQNLLLGTLEGSFPEGGVPFPARARVAETLRHDTERNHTATHLLHAALRKVLGEHVAQKGSLVAPDRLRFDFSHPQPMTDAELEAVEGEVNEGIWGDHPVRWEIVSREQALERGAMALFGEKYGDEVRVVEIPGVSLELCGGTHLRHTGEAGAFRIVRESGVAAGIRRIEAVTGPGVYRRLREAEAEFASLGELLKAPRENLRKRVEQLLREKAEVEELLEELRKGGGGGAEVGHEARIPSPEGGEAVYRGVTLRARDADDARAFGDAFRESTPSGVAVVAAEFPEGKGALFTFVTDDLVGRGVRAGDLVRELSALCGGRGGGRPHMAQGGIEDSERVGEALLRGEVLVRTALEGK